MRTPKTRVALLHHDAMAICDQVNDKRRMANLTGTPLALIRDDMAQMLYRAADMEAEAAYLTKNEFDAQVLTESAASLRAEARELLAPNP